MDADYKSLFLNILGGALLIILDRLWLYFKHIFNCLRYKWVFGNDINSDFSIVYAKFKLKPNFKEDDFNYYKPGIDDSHFKISEVVSFTETKSAKYISDSIAKNTKHASKIISDNEITDKVNISYCSLGGRSNYKTNDILDADNNYYFNFDIVKSQIFSKIDSLKSFTINNDYDYAVIIKLKNKSFPDKTQICVAGLGEWGTSGASWFLANKWKILLKKAWWREFGCVIRVKHGKDESAEIIEMITYKDYKRFISKANK